jgi:hypothetical protein
MRPNSVESFLAEKQILGMRVIMPSNEMIMRSFRFTTPKVQKKNGVAKLLA